MELERRWYCYKPIDPLTDYTYIQVIQYTININNEISSTK